MSLKANSFEVQELRNLAVQIDIGQPCAEPDACATPAAVYARLIQALRASPSIAFGSSISLAATMPLLYLIAAPCGPDCCGNTPHPICFNCKRQPPHVSFSLAQYERHTRRTQSKGNGKHVYCQICCPPLNPLTSKKKCSICGNQDLSDTQKRKNADERRCKECRNAGAA